MNLFADPNLTSPALPIESATTVSDAPVPTIIGSNVTSPASTKGNSIIDFLNGVVGQITPAAAGAINKAIAGQPKLKQYFAPQTQPSITQGNTALIVMGGVFIGLLILTASGTSRPSRSPARRRRR